MIDKITYEGNIVILKKNIKLNKTLVLKKNDIDQISKIVLDIKNKKGIKIYFSSGKFIINYKVINYKKYLKNNFKLTI